jgi:hypothetical protein
MAEVKEGLLAREEAALMADWTSVAVRTSEAREEAALRREERSWARAREGRARRRVEKRILLYLMLRLVGLGWVGLGWVGCD